MLFISLLLIGVVDVKASFAAKSPPRFDVFSEKIVGKWLGDDGVDEVMRSCGGAVQGIRELEIFSSSNNIDISSSERPYHNRANDGFIYFDCGSYSSGAVNLKNDEKDGVTNYSFMTSLSLPSTSRRTVLTASVAVGRPDLSTTIITDQPPMYVSLTRGGDPKNGDVKEDLFQKSLPSAPANVRWDHEIICRMPSIGQSWMLQRAKWEQFADTNEETQHTVDAEKINNEAQEIGWVQIKTGKSDMVNEDILKSQQIASYVGGQNSLIIQMGTVCTVTKLARAIVRCYQDDGKLLSVILQSGQMTE